MPFIEPNEVPELQIAPGCRARTPYGKHLMLSHLRIEPGAQVPPHSHPHEQAGMLLSGRMELTIGDETRVVAPGSMYIIPADTPHRAVAIGPEPAVVLDVFSPVREDYVRMTNAYFRQET